MTFEPNKWQLIRIIIVIEDECAWCLGCYCRDRGVSPTVSICKVWYPLALHVLSVLLYRRYPTVERRAQLQSSQYTSLPADNELIISLLSVATQQHATVSECILCLSLCVCVSSVRLETVVWAPTHLLCTGLERASWGHWLSSIHQTIY